MGGSGKEFGGPAGVAGVVAGLPLVTYVLGDLAAPSCPGAGGAAPDGNGVLGVLWCSAVGTAEGAALVLGWFALVLGLHLALPGKRVQGVELPGGRGRLTYKLNALPVFALILLGAGVGSFGLGALPLDAAYDQFLPLLTASTVFSFALSAYLYAASFRKGALLAQEGTTGNVVYDFFMGRELNPRLGGLDLKEFCELYPGLIGWAVLNLGMAYKQYKETGGVTNAMVLVNLFQGIYVWDALWYEPSILTTMDITTDGFGHMLCYGDLTWVPFTYTLQARYLVTQPEGLSPLAVAGIAGLNFLGYFMFRGANGQKDQFRRDPGHPSVAHLKYMPTERGTKLIISGWWGLARHINYTGDWLMGLAWCLPCGFGSAVPYFYAIYFAVLLIHRDLRDGHACEQKYGKDWAKYCSIVKYRLIPGVY